MTYTPSEFIALLNRVLPQLEPRPQGATSAAISALRAAWGVELPRFYEWFLAHFGANAGPFATERFDFAIEELLSMYDDEDPEPDPQEQEFIIAVGCDPMLPQDIAYDLRHPTPDDARVTLAGVPQFDSLEAMLAWRLYERYVLPNFPQRCSGVIRYRTVTGFDDSLENATTELGLVSALDIGTRARVLDGPSSAMTILGNYRQQPTVAFNLGTGNSSQARTLLGLLSVDHGFEVEALSWSPALA